MKRIINFANGVEVRCPRGGEDIDVLGAEGCMPGLEVRCPYLEKIDVGKIDCKWTEQEGHGHSAGG